MKKSQQPTASPPSSPAASSAADAKTDRQIDAHLADLESQAAQLDAGGTRLDEQGVAEAPAAPEKPAVPTADFLEGLLAPVAEIVLPSVHHGFAVKPVKPHEVKMLAVTWGACLDHYFPGGVASWGPVGGAIAATVAVFAPRLMIPARAPKPEADKPDA